MKTISREKTARFPYIANCYSESKPMSQYPAYNGWISDCRKTNGTNCQILSV